jgi:hypothetical protein
MPKRDPRAIPACPPSSLSLLFHAQPLSMVCPNRMPRKVWGCAGDRGGPRGWHVAQRRVSGGWKTKIARARRWQNGETGKGGNMPGAP